MQEESPLIIAGSGRSGTTWVLDSLARSNNLRTVFEPLHPELVKCAARYADRCLDGDESLPDLYAFFAHYFFAPFHSVWVDYRIRHDWLYPKSRDLISWSDFKQRIRFWKAAFADYSRFRAQRMRTRRIIKLIRGNMMLSWLRKNFDAKIVLIVRHPGAVVESMMKRPAIWKPHDKIERFKHDSTLMRALDYETRQLLNRHLSTVEALTLTWCIENSIALRQAEEAGQTVVFYENLLERGIDEWTRIVRALALSQLPSEEIITKPSQQADTQRNVAKFEMHRSADWMTRLDGSSLHTIDEFLTTTGMKMYKADQSAPIY